MNTNPQEGSRPGPSALDIAASNVTIVASSHYPDLLHLRRRDTTVGWRTLRDRKWVSAFCRVAESGWPEIGIRVYADAHSEDQEDLWPIYTVSILHPAACYRCLVLLSLLPATYPVTQLTVMGCMNLAQRKMPALKEDEQRDEELALRRTLNKWAIADLLQRPIGLEEIIVALEQHGLHLPSALLSEELEAGVIADSEFWRLRRVYPVGKERRAHDVRCDQFVDTWKQYLLDYLVRYGIEGAYKLALVHEYLIACRSRGIKERDLALGLSLYLSLRKKDEPGRGSAALLLSVITQLSGLSVEVYNNRLLTQIGDFLTLTFDSGPVGSERRKTGYYREEILRLAGEFPRMPPVQEI